MKLEPYQKESFSVIGKEGSTEAGEGFVIRLWQTFNDQFAEIAPLAKKDDAGAVFGLWGAMSDFSRTFAPWADGFSQGLYLAGVECEVDAQAPDGWTKWTVPGFQYLYTQTQSPQTFALVLAYLEENKIPLVGSVQEFYHPGTGNEYLLFPVGKL